jgi:hydroxyacylglutathione hydrolase
MSILISTIPILPFGMVNAFIVKTGGNAIVVDTGFPGSAKRVLKQLQVSSNPTVKAIILTHGHMDHAGSATELRRILKVPVIAHEMEAPYLSGKKPRLLPTKGFGQVFKLTGLIEQPFDYFVPDIAFAGAEYNLSDLGFDGATVLHTPGHTPGSLSVFLPDGQVLAGDLAASGILLGGIAMRGRPKRPPFEEDTAAVARSLTALLGLGGRRFYLGHGGPLPKRAIEKHVDKIQRDLRPH